ncbi:cation:proton antiporter [Rhodovulum euryhalinum]|uniref:Sodium/proton antiporter (CPA1 family) n=1 Tax=Rhodovulum euryhalinum TaxID=35805 RepID=A0A4R2KNU6_9RHOB|nr:sodium:proton antiporter [Rhodovulum euryhalinum]TCO72489.1 sodium/proton antiporter (CPA1 family) [Rhodovulum euryhalinum]
MATGTEGALNPVMAFALVGALGVGAQWLAWRLRLPAIVLMLVAGLVVGPGLGVFDPSRDIGDLMSPIIAIAVAIILFEGGLTLNVRSLADAAPGVLRLVILGAPLGWLFSALALHYAAGLGWAASAVFGGILIVTGPTVIAPLLRQARLARRPAQLLQWEAIVNDAVGALAAVLAFEVVIVLNSNVSPGAAAGDMAFGILLALGLGLLSGWGLSSAFRRALVAEYMKVPVLFAVVLLTFALSDAVLHESGLLAVTVMGVFIANADLPSYDEIRRFKEHATILLVSGVFILLAADMDIDTLRTLDWRALGFVLAAILLARPLTVLVSLAFSPVPWRERLLVAFTGPRGVVLVAVAGLFGERLTELGFEDGARIAPLAFVLVAATVVLHGFTMVPFARWLGLTGAEKPGVILVGGSSFATGLAEALHKADVPVLLADPNRSRLRSARDAGLPTFYGDILSEAAEHSVELVSYGSVVAATDNDAYNTLVATDLAPEFGREHVYQLKRARQESRRHALPASLGGRAIGGGHGYLDLTRMMTEGWRFRTTKLTEEFPIEAWRKAAPDAVPLAVIGPNGTPRLVSDENGLRAGAGSRVVALVPPGETATPAG